MYINYLNKELFYAGQDGTDECNIVFNPEPIGSCANYSNKEYTQMRNDYWEAIYNIYIKGTEVCKEELIKKININNAESLRIQDNYNNEIDNELKDVTHEQKTLIENKKKMEELHTNIVASEQRLSDSKKNNYRNKVKLIIFIVAIIVFVLIELILIIV
jgi:hypothetical protein